MDRGEQIRRVLVWLTTITDLAKVRQACVDSMGVTAEEANTLIDEARRRFAAAADFSREEEIGRTIEQLNRLYANAVAGKDNRLALTIVDKLAKLRGLYGEAEDDGAGGDGGEAAEELALVRAYLEPLGLGDGDTTTAELARMAAAKVVL